MTRFDDDEDFDNSDESDVRAKLTRKMRTEGALIAYRTAVAICGDPKATAAAKASAVNSLFRAGGFFANQDGDDGSKEASQMTADELDAAIRHARAELKRQQDRVAPTGGLFD